MKQRGAASVPARVHLAGNPSDGYAGAVLSTIVPGFQATVTARVSSAFTIAGPARSWPSMSGLADCTARHGHEGGDRLLTAALVTLDRILPADDARPPLALEWSTSIPRSVGLGGSSALVIATMRAALECWDLELPRHELAEAALRAETKELGIPAGIADRVAQVWETTVLTDCRDAPVATPVQPYGGHPTAAGLEQRCRCSVQPLPP